MKLEIYGPEGDMDEKDMDENSCPYCGSDNVDNVRYPEIFEGSAYFDYLCNACGGGWVLASTVDRIILDKPVD